MRGPGPKLHPGAPHAPAPGRHLLLAHLARPFQGGLGPAVTVVATTLGPAQGQWRPAGTGTRRRWCWQVGLQPHSISFTPGLWSCPAGDS